ncbi:MAG: Enterobactin exporter EntS [Paracidovorax wautersii]|uniref:Enterobactin exporter EntS n=1 Tax=Paracidovorax wautersii TaxID=1177982 RepID=A0A7V8FM69_9BURK|nr:MAG: Enterobactin exporter EntS [Paracidovorax wautersii]
MLAQRAYMRFWGTRLFGTAGTQMLMVAIGWQMYELTGSAWDLGLVGLYQFEPALLLTLVAGHVADRFHRARIVACCLAVAATVALMLVTATQEGWVNRELLLGVSVLLGMVRAFQMPAQQALTPMLVPPALLPRAMAFASAGLQGAIIGGPALGGVIFVAGASAVYAASALSFIIGCSLMVGLRYHYVPQGKQPMSMETLLAGVRFIWHRKPVLGAISLDLFAVLLGGAVALLPMFAKDILHTGPWGLGLLRASPAAGALLMSIALTRWPLERKVGQRLLGAVAMFGVATLVFAISRNLVLSMLALAVTGAMDMVSVVVRQTLVQLETPDHMRGRVSAVNSVFIGASNQLGEFESGATAALLGPVGSVILGGVGTIAVALAWRRLFPSLALRDRLHEPAPEPEPSVPLSSSSGMR